MKKMLRLILLCIILLFACTMIFACGTVSESSGSNSISNSSQSESSSDSTKDSGHTHSFTIKKAEEKYLYTSATCQKKALYYVSCECGEKSDFYFEYGDYAPHAEVTDEAIMPTCTETGLTEGKHCSVCNAVLVKQEVAPALGHDIITHSAKAATCTVNGYEAYENCSRCDYTTYIEIPAKGHTEVVDNAKTATCLETGLTAGKHCSVCNTVLEKQETVPALGHNKIQHEAKAATCTVIGYAAYETCSRCNYTTYKEISAKGHTEVTDNAKAATRTDDGLTEGKHCSVCNTVLIEQKIVHATGSLGLLYSGNSVIGIGTCTDNDIIIPKYSPDNILVTEIGDNAFADSSAISIFIPDTIKIIGTRAFYNCANITEIHIPSSVTKIGTQIFYKASNLNTVYYDSSYSNRENPFLNVANIKKIVFGGKSVPSSITYNCTNLTEIEILDGVTSIGWSTFKGCSSLTSITIPDSVTSIGNMAFCRCFKLVEVINKSSLNIVKGGEDNGLIGYYALTVHKSESIIKNIDSFLFITYDNTNYLLGYNGNKTELILPNDYNGEKYQIYMYAFTGSKITSVTIPDGIISIDHYTFYGCDGLTSITILDGVTSIGNSAFSGCSSLTSITIPDSVTSIGYDAFYGCKKLKEIHYNGTIEEWKKIKKCSRWNDNTGDYTVYCTDGNITK